MKQVKFKRGGVSMFIVMITCVLVALLVASFVRMVNRDLSNASRQDISQSAYDSAQAGIEDAKRFMAIYNRECNGPLFSVSEKCRNMEQAVANQNCNMLSSAGIGSNTGETPVRTENSTGTSQDDSLNQAYTCVQITKDTPDFLAVTTAGDSKNIQLKGTEAFSRVRISWYTREDAGRDTANLPAGGDAGRIPSLEEWTRNANRPPVMKAQFYRYSGNLESLDTGTFAGAGDGGINERLYFPSRVGNTFDVLPTTRRSGSEEPQQVQCSENLATSTYACSTLINFNRNIKNSDLAFLRLTPIYSGARVRVELLNDTNQVVNFDGVQPRVDSTGRANNRFRRVESRIEYEDTNFPVPDFAVWLGGNDTALCKDFWVTNLRNSGDLSCVGRG